MPRVFSEALAFVPTRCRAPPEFHRHRPAEQRYCGRGMVTRASSCPKKLDRAATWFPGTPTKVRQTQRSNQKGQRPCVICSPACPVPANPHRQRARAELFMEGYHFLSAGRRIATRPEQGLGVSVTSHGWRIIRRIGEVATLFVECRHHRGHRVISPFRDDRRIVRELMQQTSSSRYSGYAH